MVEWERDALCTCHRGSLFYRDEWLQLQRRQDAESLFCIVEVEV